MSGQEQKEQQGSQADLFGEEYSVEKAKDSRGTARRLLKNLMEQKWKLLIVLISTVSASAFGLLSPKVMGIAINQIFDGIKTAVRSGGSFRVDLETMGWILSLLLGLYLLCLAVSC